MTDMTDDWMNPKPLVWETKKPENKVEYLIERAAAVPVTGNVAYITDWRFWSSHDTAAGRDAEMRRLSDDHPMWRLRPRDRNPYLESIGIFPPNSHPGINPKP